MRRLLILAPLLFTACPPADPCARVVCPYACNPDNGRCLDRDGGEEPDDDGGTGGGMGGGSADAGLPCNPACGTGQVCDGRTGTCVSCVTDEHCSCPTPVCSNGFCVGPIPDAGVVVPTPGETCADAPLLSIPGCGPRSSTFRFDTSGHANDLNPSCAVASNAGGDATFKLLLDATYDVLVSVAPAPGSNAEPVLAVNLDSCSSTSELVCREGVGGAATLRLKSRPAGSYVLVLDSYASNTTGLVDVTITFAAPTQPANETCGTAIPLPLDGGVQVIELGSALDDLATSCNAAGADTKDVVYTFTTSQPTDFIAVARNLSGNSNDPSAVLSLRDSACDKGDELVCARAFQSPRAALSELGLAAGTYYLVVDAANGATAGPTSLVATAQPMAAAPAFDTCVAPRNINIDPTTRTATFVVDTLLARNDEVGSCNDPDSTTFPGSGGPEFIYQFTLTSAARTTITASDAVDGGSGVDPVIYLRRGTCSSTADAGTDNEVACADELPGNADVIDESLTAGTYFLFVEGYGSSGAGPTRITITLAP